MRRPADRSAVRKARPSGRPSVGAPAPAPRAGRRLRCRPLRAAAPTWAPESRRELNGQFGPTVAMIQENRSLTRDLLEVPESLDDLADARSDHVRGRPVSRNACIPRPARRSRYQIGAARFNAALEWNGTQLVKRIDAADGFRMTETYFLSEDGKRLFVILRVGSNRKNAPVMGVNRVYDRVDQ